MKQNLKFLDRSQRNVIPKEITTSGSGSKPADTQHTGKLHGTS